jgi:hypothetical protein
VRGLVLALGVPGVGPRGVREESRDTMLPKGTSLGESATLPAGISLVYPLLPRGISLELVTLLPIGVSLGHSSIVPIDIY